MIDLRGRVAVVTGASSGLGRALALELVARGAAVALAARRAGVLAELARRCEREGGEALAVATDVTVEAEVERLAAAALARWGQIDIWINNAGVTLYAPLEDGPFELHRRVIETNLFGAMYGARVVLPIFRRQGRGVLVNVGSALGELGHAFAPAYAISKRGVRGLSEALRVEVADEPGLHVCTVLPYALDTPHLQVAASRIERAPRPLPPVQTPERVARAIADLAARPRRQRCVPRALALAFAVHALFPRTAERLLLDALRRWHLTPAPQRTQEGNLYTPASAAPTIRGDRRPLLGGAALAAWLVARLAHRGCRAAARALAARGRRSPPRRAAELVYRAR